MHNAWTQTAMWGLAQGGAGWWWGKGEKAGTTITQ